MLPARIQERGSPLESYAATAMRTGTLFDGLVMNPPFSVSLGVLRLFRAHCG
jgi:hypothetical protein